MDELFNDILRTLMFLELEERRLLELFLEMGSCEILQENEAGVICFWIQRNPVSQDSQKR